MTGIAVVTGPGTGCTSPAAAPDIVLGPASAGTDCADAAACCEVVANQPVQVQNVQMLQLVVPPARALKPAQLC